MWEMGALVETLEKIGFFPKEIGHSGEYMIKGSLRLSIVVGWVLVLAPSVWATQG